MPACRHFQGLPRFHRRLFPVFFFCFPPCGSACGMCFSALGFAIGVWEGSVAPSRLSACMCSFSPSPRPCPLPLPTHPTSRRFCCSQRSFLFRRPNAWGLVLLHLKLVCRRFRVVCRFLVEQTALRPSSSLSPRGTGGGAFLGALRFRDC